MRDIKFRAFIEGEMIDAEHLAFEEYKPLKFQLSKCENLTQYTGFKDCNGREIYEGDIIGDWIETDEGKIQSKYEVFWNQHLGQWQVDESTKKDRTACYELWEELYQYKFEVIGNIYENYELLDKCS